MKPADGVVTVNSPEESNLATNERDDDGPPAKRLRSNTQSILSGQCLTFNVNILLTVQLSVVGI